jgi:hypothetical protein
MPKKKSKKQRVSGSKSAARPELTQEELAALDFIIKSAESRGFGAAGLDALWDAAAYAKAVAALARWAARHMWDWYFRQNDAIGQRVFGVLSQPGISEKFSQTRMREVEKLLKGLPAPSLEDLKRVRLAITIKNPK